MSRTNDHVEGSISTAVPIYDPANTSKNFQFDLSSTSGSNTYSLPPSSTSLVGTTTTQTLENKTLTNTPSITGPTDSNLTISPGSNQNVVVNGNFVTQGGRTNIESTALNISSPYVYLNNGYESTSTTGTGIVTNYQATATASAVTGSAFSSSTTVEVVSAAGLSPGDFIQISLAANTSNNGIYEVASIVSNTITIASNPTNKFAQTSFIPSATISGSVRKINLSILGVGSNGQWQTAIKTSASATIYNTLLTSNNGKLFYDISGTTTNGTPTALGTSIATSTNYAYLVRCNAIAYDIPLTESAGFEVGAMFNNIGGTLAQVSIDDTLYFRENSTKWDLEINPTGTNIIFVVTGENGKTINWRLQFTAQVVQIA